MRRPDLIWEMTYSSSRRAHSHRCFCCRKIIVEGDRVHMWRPANKVTRAMHIECGAVAFPAVHDGDPKTMLELATIHAKEHQDRLYGAAR